MKTNLVFLSFVIILVGAYLDLIWLSALGLALVGLFAAFLPNQKRLASNERYNPPTVFRK